MIVASLSHPPSPLYRLPHFPFLSLQMQTAERWPWICWNFLFSHCCKKILNNHELSSLFSCYNLFLLWNHKAKLDLQVKFLWLNRRHWTQREFLQWFMLNKNYKKKKTVSCLFPPPAPWVWSSGQTSLLSLTWTWSDHQDSTVFHCTSVQSVQVPGHRFSQSTVIPEKIFYNFVYIDIHFKAGFFKKYIY